jgi:hypothetical protein
MNELELLQQISDKRSELERNKATGVSSSLIKLQEEEIKELEYIFATGDQNRLAGRIFLDQCGKGKEEFPDDVDDYDDEY